MVRDGDRRAGEGMLLDGLAERRKGPLELLVLGIEGRRERDFSARVQKKRLKYCICFRFITHSQTR